MSNDNPPPGEFAPEQLEELALETAVKIAAIRCTDTTDILFFVAISSSFAEAAKQLSGNVTEQGLRSRFTRIFNSLELPFPGTHAEQNKQAMWVVQRAFQIVEDQPERFKKTAEVASKAETMPTPVVEPEREPELTEEPEALAQPELVTAEPEPASEPEVAAAPEPAGAPALSEVADLEMERVMGLIRAMPLDANLRILAGYTFGGTFKEIGELLGLTKDQVGKRMRAIRSNLRIPQMSDHGMFGSREFDFLVRAFEGVYLNGLRERSEEGIAA